MNPTNNAEYNPADDDNQGVVQLMARGEEAGAGTPQDGGIDPIRASGPESEKAEVNDSDTNGANDDLLVEEDVETGDIAESNEQ